MSWKKRWPAILLFVVICLVAVSLLSRPVALTAPPRPILTGARIDDALLSTFRRSCGDCHSDFTVYPWYSYVAPVSLLIRSDVNEGRRHLNLSMWSEYPVARRVKLLGETEEQVRKREMPLWYYVVLHPDAKLSDADRNAIVEWTQGERARLLEAPRP